MTVLPVTQNITGRTVSPRQVNMSLAKDVAIHQRPDKQQGLFALRPVPRGTILIIYDGPIIDHPTRYSIQITDNQHIEGTPESNAYLNHSCAPNTYVDWKGVFLRALRDLAAGEELTCNYLTTDWDLHEKFVCTCGAPNCFGEIKGFRYLSLEQQRELEPFVPEFMKKRIPGNVRSLVRRYTCGSATATKT